MAKHALFSPSGFQALMLCPAKPAMERGRPDDSNEYADEGSAAHYLGAECLRAVIDEPTIGDVIVVHADGECSWLEEMPAETPEGARCFEVDAEFAQHVQTYINTVRDYQGEDGELFVEQSLPIGHITGEEDAEGTGDSIILRRDEIIVIDLKFGRGVEVSADDNPQLKLYGLGALAKYDLVGDIKRVRTVICQPRAGGTSECVYDVADLLEWGVNVARPAAQRAAAIMFGGAEMEHHPHEDACRFCRAKGDCPALAAKVQQAMGLEFTDLTTTDATAGEAIVEAAVTTADAAGKLGAAMDAVPLIELWCKAVRARVEKHLLAGESVEGYKLVAGKRGARAWRNEAEVEKLLKGMRLKKEQMYDFKLISPTSAEKLLKPTPKRWTKLQTHIEQAEGKPSVAPVTDRRPALEIQPVSSEFTPITDTPATADDLV